VKYSTSSRGNGYGDQGDSLQKTSSRIGAQHHVKKPGLFFV
jgi:hypothetical protein